MAVGAPARAGSEVSILDVVELDMGYTTIADNYYRNVPPAVFLGGARTGIVAYLRGQGVSDPQVGFMHARADGRGVVPAIEQQLGKAIDRYGARVVPRDLIHSAIRGEVAALNDPYSVFYDRSELRRFTSALDGTPFGGIGIVVALDAAKHAMTEEVFSASPAERAGLIAGDRVLAVDGTPVDGLDSAALARLLRGRIGTLVRIDVERSGAPDPLHLTLTRAAITPPDVRERLLPGGIGYVALRTFGPNAGQQIHAALARLRADGARATIFDLRGNGGGYETAALRVASAFVASGPIVLTQTNHGRRTATDADGSALPPQPLVILVDGDSASGSELVTGAIADRGLAKVVGTRTFGKGVVQSMFPLPDGCALKVTTARYFTPAGHDIDRIGITPDVVVPEPPDAVRGVPGHDPQLDAALTLLAPAGVSTPPVAPATNR